jgi:hypothetical protein
MKPGWCCCCRRPDRPACGGRPQSKNCWKRSIRCQSVYLWCGSRSCRQIGRDPAGWFNPESQTHGLSSTGTMTISSQVSCTASFPRSQAAASAKAHFGTWLCSMGSKRNGAIPRLSSQTVPSWMQRLFLKRGLLGFRAIWEIEMDNSCNSGECSTKDLTGRKAAWFLWYVPILFVIVGSSWSRGRVWLWVPAFVVMGVGCLANAARCGRIHCYVTGPLFLFAAVFVVLSGLGVVSLHPGLFLLIVLGACCLAQCAEIPLGRYRRG